MNPGGDANSFARRIIEKPNKTGSLELVAAKVVTGRWGYVRPVWGCRHSRVAHVIQNR